MQALLLTMIGPTPFKLLSNLISPDKPEDKTYDELMEAMKRHHKLTPSEIVQRYRFNSHFRLLGTLQNCERWLNSVIMVRV